MSPDPFPSDELPYDCGEVAGIVTIAWELLDRIGMTDFRAYVLLSLQADIEHLGVIPDQRAEAVEHACPGAIQRLHDAGFLALVAGEWVFAFPPGFPTGIGLADLVARTEAVHEIHVLTHARGEG